MILITGATGTVGRELVKQLTLENQKVRVLVRDPARAGKLGDSVEVCVGDLSKPESLGAAFAGVEKVFLLATGLEIVSLEGNAIEAARAAGVRHVVKLSAHGVEFEPEIQIGRWHREIEEKLKASGMAWTMLRPGAFASNALMWAGSIKAQGAVFSPTGEGKTAPIHPRDIAAVAAKALTSPGHEGKAYTLTGPEALSTAEEVRMISEALGKPVAYVDVPEDAARAGMLKSGMPEEMIDAVLELMRLIKSGGAASVSPAVAEVLGREPLPFAAWVRENVAAFQ